MFVSRRSPTFDRAELCRLAAFDRIQVDALVRMGAAAARMAEAGLASNSEPASRKKGPALNAGL
jgi:hypothetical protein